MGIMLTLDTLLLKKKQTKNAYLDSKKFNEKEIKLDSFYYK